MYIDVISTNSSFYMKLKLLLTCFLLASCGGGGNESDTDSDRVDPPINPPSFSEECIDAGLNIERCTFTHNNIERYYLIYVPANIDQNSEIPLLFSLHGYGGSAIRNIEYTNFRSLADENGFIVIFPQGAPFTSQLVSSSSHWNSGGWTSGSDVDDVDFIETIIDQSLIKHNINESRIYSTGMSNGGFMSYHLACNLSSRIAAIASVTGSMTFETYDECNPSHPTPVLQIHGALDPTVPFSGNTTLGMKSIPDSMNYWATFNSCDAEPVIAIADFFDEGYSIQYDYYENCMNNVSVELVLHSTMRHTWPNFNSLSLPASISIWDFLSQYDLNGLID